MSMIVVKAIPTLLNRLYIPICRGNHPTIVKSKDAKSFVALVRAEAIRQRIRKISDCDVSMKIDFCFTGRDKDIDAPLKLILDSLEGIMYKNDKQIVDLRIRKHRNSKDNEIVVLVEEYLHNVTKDDIIQ